MDEPQEDVDKVKDGPCCGRVTIAMFNATWVGICFLGLFSSFNPIQALQSGTIRNDYGFYGIAVLYGTFSIATLVASQVVRVLGQKIGLFLGALCYLIYIATLLVLALIPDISDDAYRALYFTASAIIGMGAAVLWTSQGSLLTVMADKGSLGGFNGIFWSVFMVNYVIGGLITQFVLNNTDSSVLYIIFSCMAGASVLGLLLIRTTPSIAPGRMRSTVQPVRLTETARIMFERRFRYLWPAMCYSGFSSSFFSVYYTAYIGKEWVGLTLVVFGAAEVFGSLVGGRVSDRIGRSPVFLASCVMTLVGVCFAAMSPRQSSGDGVWMYFLAFAFMGLGDSGFNTQVQAAVGYYHKSASQPAFAGYRFLLSITSMTGAISGRYLHNLAAPWDIFVPCAVLWGVLFLALFGWVILDLYIDPVSEPKREHDLLVNETNH